MASFGNINTTAYNNRHLTFSWTTKTQSIENNHTVISWALAGAGTATGYYKAAPFTVIINGETVYSSSTRIELRDGTKVASGEAVIKHNADGTKRFSVSVSAAIYSYTVNVSASGSWDLNAIPKGAKITASTAFTDISNPTISYTNAAGESVTSL